MTTALATPELRTIRVYGTLARLIGCRTLRATVSSVPEAMRFLIANFPQVEGHLKERFFKVKIANWALSESDLNAPIGLTEEVHIIPAICGAGGNGPVVGILAGAALIGAGLLVPFGGAVLTNLGLGLLLTGVSALLSPTPTVPDKENDPARSYNFSGIQQTSTEGVPVPLVYGDIVTGSVVLSVAVGTDANQDEELEPDFAGGEGNPNPDQNPVPGPGGGDNGLPPGWPGRAPEVVLADDMQDEYPGICWNFAAEVYIRQNPSCNPATREYDTYILCESIYNLPSNLPPGVHNMGYNGREFRLGGISLDYYLSETCTGLPWGAQFTVHTYVNCSGETVNSSGGWPAINSQFFKPPREWSTVGHRVWRQPAAASRLIYPNAPIELIAEETTQNPAYAGYSIALPDPQLPNDYPYVGQP